MQAALDIALEQLQKEDPSFRIKIDRDTGQTVMGGKEKSYFQPSQYRNYRFLEYSSIWDELLPFQNFK